MALVNPNIAMSFRAPEIQQQNMLADYAALQQIQGGRQAQELNALKMQEAQAALTERNALRQLNPTAADYESQLFKVSPQLGIQYRKEAATTAAQQAATKLSEAKTAEASLDTNRKKLKYAWESVGDASTPDLAIQKIADGMTSGVFSQQDGAAEIQQLQNMTPEDFRQYRINKISQILDAKDKFGAMLPKIARQDTGSAFTPIQDNPALPGYGLPVAGMASIPKTETFADVNARKRLEFDKAKEAWQRANPGFELKEAEDGTTYGVNKNTLQAFPVTIGGGAAPAAAPAADAAKPFKGKDSSKTAVSEQQAAYNIGRVLTAANQIKDISGKDPSSAQPGAAEALAASVGMTGTANLARNANRQIVQGAQRDALDALLYLATGAAYNKEQLQGQMDAYIPAFTDTAKAVAAKKTRMTALIKSAKTRAGKAWTPEMDTAMDALTSPPAPAAAAAPRVAPPAGFTPD